MTLAPQALALIWHLHLYDTSTDITLSLCVSCESSWNVTWHLHLPWHDTCTCTDNCTCTDTGDRAGGTATHCNRHCNRHCNTLQQTLQHTATHTATHCNTHCNTHCVFARIRHMHLHSYLTSTVCLSDTSTVCSESIIWVYITLETQYHMDSYAAVCTVSIDSYASIWYYTHSII